MICLGSWVYYGLFRIFLWIIALLSLCVLASLLFRAVLLHYYRMTHKVVTVFTVDFNTRTVPGT